MNWQAVSFDWNHVRAFLATVEEGSLSAGARALGLTQPTLGRQVAALEEDLGVVLFDRAGRGLALSPSGKELLTHVRAMADAANRVSIAATGQSQTVEGEVTISASDVMSTYVLPRLLGQLRALAPGISVTVIASNSLSDLTRREADIAIRHVRPDQPDLIAKLMRDVPGHIYAAQSLLDRIDKPTTLDDLSDVDFISYGNIDQMIQHLGAVGLNLTPKNFVLNCENGVAAWEMARLGLGMGVMMRDVALRTSDMVPVLPELFAIPVSTWLTTHRELHTSRRIRLVFDLLAQALG